MGGTPGGSFEYILLTKYLGTSLYETSLLVYQSQYLSIYLITVDIQQTQNF